MDTHATSSPAYPVISLDVSQEKYLPARGGPQELHAIVTVEVAAPHTAAPGQGLAEVLVLDCSSSMSRPEEKFRAAKSAAVAALRMLPDGTPFAVVAGNHEAAMVYPDERALRPASETERASAERAVRGLLAAGGTCVGSWLDLSRQLLEPRRAPLPHVLMLTDGRNEHDSRMPLAGVLDACQDRLLCDAWGIGVGWDAEVLLAVTRRLHGSADAVREEAALPEAYRSLMTGLLAKAVPELVIRVTPSPGTTVRYLSQVYPHELPLREGEPAAGRGSAFRTRGWGTEVRRFQLCLTADPGGQPVGEDLQVAAVDVELPGGEPAAGFRPPPQRACVVHWTDDPLLSRRTSPEVEHFQLWGRLGETVALAHDAYRRDRHERAEELLGRAVALAHRAGAQRQLAELRRLVDIHDAAAGRVTLRPGLESVDFHHLMTASTHSTYGPGRDDEAAGTEGTAGPDALTECRACGRTIPVSGRFCPKCGAPKAAA